MKSETLPNDLIGHHPSHRATWTAAAIDGDDVPDFIEAKRGANEVFTRGAFVIAAGLFLFLAFQIWLTWRVSQQQYMQQAPIATFGSVRLQTGSAICPGDTIRYSVALDVDDSGVLIVDNTAWQLDPLRILYDAPPRRVVVSGDTDLPLYTQFHLPDMYIDPETGDPVPWLPGYYALNSAISTSSRATVPQIVTIPFSIREDCPNVR